MTEELGLSEDQKQKIYQINLENAEKRQAQRDAMQEKQKSKRTEMQAQNKARNERMEAILTSEQKTRWDEVKKDNRDKIREGSRRGQRGGKGGSGSGSGSSII
jgi:Tfp pilus assembly major pilin PilA